MRVNKITNMIIVILIFICSCLIGFIIFDHNKDKNNTNDDIIVNENNTNDDIIVNENNEKINDVVVTNISQYPKENSDDVLLFGELFNTLLNNEQKKLINSHSNFNNVKLRINNIDLTYSCTEFIDSLDFCEEGYVQFPYMKLNFSNSLGCGSSKNIIYTNDYLLLHHDNDCVNDGFIEIYDKYGNSLLTINNILGRYNNENNNFVDTTFKYVNGILYYVSYVDYKTISFNYVDLREFTKIQIHNIEVFESNSLGIG